MSEGGETVEQIPTNTVEKSIVDKIGGSIIDDNQFQEFREQNGFTNGFHGTWRSGENSVYLYTKRGFLVDTEQQAQASLKAVRHLTEKGILYPNTQWGIYHTDRDQYQLFAVTRELEGWNPDINGKGSRGWVKTNIGESQNYRGLLDEDSHILKWMRRIDPGFDPNKDSNKKPNKGLIELLNVFEASHSDNWGWDSDGKLYPIDIEVVSVEGERNQDIVNKWVAKNK
jgi:hypothetical protein